jgi:hypothetical protein
MNRFCISCTSDKIWNQNELITFLVAHQHQTIELSPEPEAICLNNIGLYNILDCFDFSQVNIFTWNPLEHHDRYRVHLKSDNFWFRKKHKIDHELQVWNTDKIFFCFYHRPTAARLGIASYINDRYPEKSLIHFSAKVDADNLIQFELDKLMKYDTSSIEPAGRLISKLPYLLGSSDRYTDCHGYDYSDPLTFCYQNILIDLVVESHVAGNTFFPTEKTTRPMWLKKPFIVFASRNYLDYLHQMGFQTFCKYWSEDYDGYDARDRYIKILQLIDELSKKSHSELESMYQHMQHELDHNYNLLLNQNYKTQITYIP